MMYDHRPTQKTLRRVAALHEMASLGLYAARAGRLLGLRDEWVCILRKRFGIGFPRAPVGSPRNEALHRGIEEGFAAGLSAREIARRTGSTEGSIRVLLNRKKLHYSPGRTDPAILRRGFGIPDHLRDRYKELRKLGLTMNECGYELGLVERPQPEARL